MNLSFHHGRIQQERGHLQTSKKDLTHTVGTLALDLTRLKNYEKQVSCWNHLVHDILLWLPKLTRTSGGESRGTALV